MEPESKYRDGSSNDEIRPKDGLVRFWMFLNGETFRLFSALIAGFFAILWCFLYFFGLGATVLSITLLVLASLGFLAWRVTDSELRKYA